MVAEAGAGTSTLLSAAGAALVVAVLGTVGRLFRTAALPAAGVPAVAASSQVTAFGTALGGVLLFSDAFSTVGVVCAVTAAGLGVAAVVAGTRWRLSRDLALAEALALRPHPGGELRSAQRDSRQSPKPSNPVRPSTSSGSPRSASTRRLSAASRATWGYSSDSGRCPSGNASVSCLQPFEPGDGVGHRELVVAHRPLVADDGQRQLEGAVGIGGGHRGCLPPVVPAGRGQPTQAAGAAGAAGDGPPRGCSGAGDGNRTRIACLEGRGSSH